MRMRFAIFAHSWRSDWNHGNAHFLRGLASSLVKLGQQVHCYEQSASWSYQNLLSEGERGHKAVQQFEQTFPELSVQVYPEGDLNRISEHLKEVDVVLVHEWNSPEFVNSILDLKAKLGFLALFHDTHHRAYTNPREILEINLPLFDGVLAFGEALCRVYRDAFGIKRTWVFHEAADTVRFHPDRCQVSDDVVWIGNWGDDERKRELEAFLLHPLQALRCRSTVYGVRYPAEVRETLQRHGIGYAGYLPNLEAARVYGKCQLTLHIPRRFYNNGLSGVPTIRVFEALACGIPLVCSPWSDTEGLFRAGQDYLIAPSSEAMRSTIAWLLKDSGARHQIAAQGLARIRERHTCDHRARQLLEIVEELQR
jgi:spore maturation protein CgeB